MAELKTKPTDGDVEAFLAAIDDDLRREDSAAVCAMLAEVTGEPPVLWGSAIVGFGTYRYDRSDGKGYEWFVTGFSPRKRSLTVYVMDGFDGRDALLDRLGPHSTGKSCLYLRSLAAVDVEALRDLVTESVRAVRASST